jgi:hypothetical protein
VLYRSDRSAVSGLAPRVVAGKVPELQTALPALAPGVYTVAWTSVSGEDGHTLQQFFAFTVGTPPPAAPTAALPPLKAGDTMVSLKLSRGNVGPVSVSAAVTDAQGKPLSNLQRVLLRIQPAGLSIGQDEIVAPANGSNATSPPFTLGLSGAWQFDVIVRRAGLDDVSAQTQITVAPVPLAAVSPTAAPAPPTAPAATPTAAVSSTAPTVQPTATGSVNPTVPPSATALAPTEAPPTAAPLTALPTLTVVTSAAPAAGAAPTATAAAQPTTVEPTPAPAGATVSPVAIAVGVVVVVGAIGGLAWWRRR